MSGPNITSSTSLNGVTSPKTAEQTAPSVSAPLVTRHSVSQLPSFPETRGKKLSDEFRGLDLAETQSHVSSLKGKEVSSHRLELFSPISSNMTVKPLDDVQSKIINKTLNRVSKTEVSTILSKKDERFVAVELAKSIDPLIVGLRALKADPEATKVLGELTHKGSLLKADDIHDLLASKSPEDNRAGLKALKALSKLCENPDLLFKTIRTATFDGASHQVSPIQVQTQFIKASRSLIADTYFDTTLSKDLQAGIKGLNLTTTKGKVDIDITKYIANVGFNRLMSENNLLGASLSSDVDFKLVLDDVQLKADLVKKGMSPEEADVAIDKVKQSMIGVLKTTQTKFEEDFHLTLEVQDFTVKKISTLQTEAGKDQVEQNFLATVLHNHSFMSGDEGVKDKFIGIIQDSLKFKEIASRNFEQNLGDSDKGSIRAIKNLSAMDGVLKLSSQLITSTPKLKEQFIASLEAKLPADSPIRKMDYKNSEILKQIMYENPSLVKSCLTHEIKTELLKVPELTHALGEVDMFKKVNQEDKLGLVLKVTGTFTKQVDGVVNRNFIGSPNLNPADNCIFSVKFAGCRLNDALDMIPKPVFCLTDGRDVSESSKTYDSVKKVASAINAFSIQMQNRTYESAIQSGLEHGDIDTLYDRVTTQEFSNMLKNPESLPKIKAMVDNLATSLGNGIQGSAQDIQQIKKFQTFLNENTATTLSKMPDDQLRTKSFELFNAIFNITDKASQLLHPQEIQLPETQTSSMLV